MNLSRNKYLNFPLPLFNANFFLVVRSGGSTPMTTWLSNHSNHWSRTTQSNHTNYNDGTTSQNLRDTICRSIKVSTLSILFASMHKYEQYRTSIHDQQSVCIKKCTYNGWIIGCTHTVFPHIICDEYIPNNGIVLVRRMSTPIITIFQHTSCKQFGYISITIIMWMFDSCHMSIR